MTEPTARIHAYLARKANKAVILRRGPSDWVQMLSWDTDKDLFFAGQWLKARVFEDFCDISPSGKYFIYGARKNGRNGGEQYTAVSKPPYFTALALWQRNMYQGTAIFESDKRVWLTNSVLSLSLPQQFYVDSDAIPSPSKDLNSFRLEREGWQMVTAGSPLESKWKESIKIKGNSKQPVIRRKYLASQTQSGTSLLMYILDGPSQGPSTVFRFLVVDDRDNLLLDLQTAQWADWDHNGDLLFAREGKVFRIKKSDHEPFYSESTIAIELIDLNANSFEPVVAPEWAQSW